MFEHRIHAYLRANAGARAHRVGPFLASFDPHDAGPYRNYAVPDDGAEPTAAEVRALVEAFAERARLPRLEYLPDASPQVERALLTAGFRAEGRLPIMVCDAARVAVPELDGVAMALARTDADLRAAAEVQNEAYGAPAATEHDVARLRGLVDAGGLVTLARVGGDPAGCGLVTGPRRGVAELAGIGVRAAHRRLGIAAGLTALLTAACPAAGIAEPFLTPADASAERVYLRVGYRRRSEILHISRQAGERAD